MVAAIMAPDRSLVRGHAARQELWHGPHAPDRDPDRLLQAIR